MGTLLNSYRFTAGPSYTTDTSLILAGGDYLNAGNALATLLNGSNAFSITAWVKPNSLGDNGWLLNKRLNTDGEGVIFYRSANDALLFFIEGTGGASDRLWSRSVDSILTTGWNHIAVTYDGSTNDSGVTFYVGGSSQSKNAALSNTLSNSAANAKDLWIGDRENASDPFNGRVYGLQIWDTELSGAQVAALEADTSLPADSATNLSANWRMGNDPDDTTSVIKDRTGGFDATPSGIVAGDFVTDAP